MVLSVFVCVFVAFLGIYIAWIHTHTRMYICAAIKLTLKRVQRRRRHTRRLLKSNTNVDLMNERTNLTMITRKEFLLIRASEHVFLNIFN